MNDLMNLLKERRTYRRFCQKPISEEILAEILTAARYASSAANKQPLSYVVVKTPQKVQEVFAETKWAAYLPKEQGQPKAGEEPVLFIGVVQNLKINPNCDTDAGLAISNMTLAAWNHGVGSCIRWWHLVIHPISAGLRMSKRMAISATIWMKTEIMSFRNGTLKMS